jgi:RNA polymerase sigma-70 factor (ECF subfamily)
VGKLKPNYRAVIHLYYYEGYRQDEIAKILGISRTAVQTRMQRAREILKKELNENG